MSELGNLLNGLRGDMSQAKLASATGLSTRTIVRAESGYDVALDTLRKLARYHRLSEGQYSALLKAWIKLKLGPDAKFLRIEPINPATGQRPDDIEDFIEVFKGVPAKYQRELNLALKRGEVLRSIGTLNSLYDDVMEQAKHAPKGAASKAKPNPHGK